MFSSHRQGRILTGRVWLGVFWYNNSASCSDQCFSLHTKLLSFINRNVFPPHHKRSSSPTWAALIKFVKIFQVILWNCHFVVLKEFSCKKKSCRKCFRSTLILKWNFVEMLSSWCTIWKRFFLLLETLNVGIPTTARKGYADMKQREGRKED